MPLGEMQDWPLRVTRLVDHAEREHGDGEIVTAWADGRITRTNWRNVARDARKMAQALERLGIKPGGNLVSWLMLSAIKRRAEESTETAETREGVAAYSG